MKKLIFILMLALAAGAAQAQVKFETKSTDAVREMAVKTGKLVFIDLYATWCPPCRTMEREVFSRKDVGDFMERHFVAAKYDVDKTTGKELLKRYGSGAIPLYLVFDTQGELLGRIQGVAKPTNSWPTCKRSSTDSSPNRESNHLGSCIVWRRRQTMHEPEIDRGDGTSRHPA